MEYVIFFFKVTLYLLVILHIPLFVRAIYTIVFCKGMSNMRTAPEVGLRVVQEIRADMAAKGNPAGYKIVDLGSAYGYYGCQIAQELPQASVLGIDCDPGGVAFGNAMAKSKKIKNVEFIKGDLFAHDITQYDAIVFYLPDYLMDQMGQRLREAAKPGTLIVSNRFKLGAGWDPYNVVEVATGFNKQGRLSFYRK